MVTKMNVFIIGSESPIIDPLFFKHFSEAAKKIEVMDFRAINPVVELSKYARRLNHPITLEESNKWRTQAIASCDYVYYLDNAEDYDSDVQRMKDTATKLHKPVLKICVKSQYWEE